MSASLPSKAISVAAPDVQSPDVYPVGAVKPVVVPSFTRAGLPDELVRTVTLTVAPQVATGQEIDGVVPDVERRTKEPAAPLAIESKLLGKVMVCAFAGIAKPKIRTTYNAANSLGMQIKKRSSFMMTPKNDTAS